MTFIAEGGPLIGLGHVMRCIAVAEQVRECGHAPFFIVNNSGAAAASVRAHAFRVKRAVDIEKACARLGDAIAGKPVLVDSKRDVSRLVRGLQRMGCTVTLVDNGTRARLIADNVVYPLAHFRPGAMSWKRARGSVYGGIKYFPLRKEFMAAPRAGRGRYVLVSMGGADFNNLTRLALESLEGAVDDMKIIAVIGRAFFHRAWLNRYRRVKRKDVEIAEEPADFPSLVRSARIVITALGVTVYEAAYFRKRIAVINNYETDRDDGIRLQRLGVCTSLGLYRDMRRDDLVKCVRKIVSSGSERGRIARSALPDGRGAWRVAKLLLRSHEEPSR